MTSSTSHSRKGWLALALALAALPALAQGGDPIEAARAAIAAGDGIAAEAAARRALAEGAPREAVAAYMGEAFALQGDEHKALTWLEPGAFDPASAELGFRALGRLYVERGAYGEAAEAFDRALALGRPSSGLWVDIARLRYRSGEQTIVADAINRALAIDPRDADALSLQAQLVRDSRGLAASLPWFERAVEIAPDNVALLGDYAAVLGELGEYREMLAVVRRMFEIDPREPRIYYFQAVLAARAGQDNLARRLLWRAGEELTEAPAGLLLSGILEYRTGNPALAAERFAALVRQQPDNRTAQALLARALLGAGDRAEVIARLGEPALRDDASPYLLTLLARAYEQGGRREEAASLLDRAARAGMAEPIAYPLAAADRARMERWASDSSRPVVAALRLRYLLGEARLSEASDLAAELNADFPGSADIKVLTGDAALLAGQSRAALASYAAAGEVRSPSSLTRRVALALRLSGDEAGADELLAETLRLNPRDREIALLLGRRRAEQGDWPRAAALLAQAARLGGTRDPRLLAELSQAQLRAGERTAALASARRAHALQPMQAEAVAALAAALSANGAAGSDILLAKAAGLQSAPALARR